ncbi:MAG: hypothetical protein ACERIH_04785 [Labilibaculum antarcticum]
MNIEAEKFKKENYHYYNMLFELIADYYSQFDKLSICDKTYYLWLESLDVSGSKEPRDLGLSQASDNLNFKRFVLELNDFGLTDYLRINLPEQMFQKWNDTECINGEKVFS